MQLFLFTRTSPCANSHIEGGICMQLVTYFLMFYLNHHGSTQMCRLRDVFMCVFAHWKTAVCTLFWLTKTCLCVNFNIRHYVCHQISNRRSRNDVQPHDLTYEPFSVCNFSHTKSCLRTLVWPTRRIVMRVHCEKTSLYTTFWLTRTFPRANFLIEGCVYIQLVT